MTCLQAEGRPGWPRTPGGPEAQGTDAPSQPCPQRSSTAHLRGRADDHTAAMQGPGGPLLRVSLHAPSLALAPQAAPPHSPPVDHLVALLQPADAGHPPPGGGPVQVHDHVILRHEQFQTADDVPGRRCGRRGARVREPRSPRLNTRGTWPLGSPAPAVPATPARLRPALRLAGGGGRGRRSPLEVRVSGQTDSSRYYLMGHLLGTKCFIRMRI